MSVRTWLVAVVVLAACETPIDTTRVPADTGSFGTVVYTLACKRLAYGADREDGNATVDVSGNLYRDFCRKGTTPPPDPYPSVRALNGNRPGLIGAVDGTFPSADLDPLQAFLSSDLFLPVYDDGTAEKAADRLAALFGLMAADPDFTAAMARLDGRLGYRPALAQSGALRQVAAYPKLDGFLLTFTDAVAPGGPAHEAMAALQLAAARELQDAQIIAGRDKPDRTLKLATDLLLTESPLLGTGKPRWLVRRDLRGLAIVQDDAGTLPAPFADKDHDGLADADASGRYVDASGKPVVAPAPFAVSWQAETAPKRDADGRATTAAGKQLYKTVDLDKTVLAALARDLPELANPLKGTALNLLRGASSLLGSRISVTKAFTTATKPLTYRGYSAPNAALLDMIYGYLDVLADAQVDDTLAVVRSLVNDHEAQAARLMEAMFDAADLGKTFPDAKLEPGSALYDDLMAVVLQILNEPGLAEDVLVALEDPAVRGLGHRFGDLMKYKDQIGYDPDSQAVVGSMRTPVDRSQPDSDYNRSLFQRVLHLISDSAGWQLCNKDGAVITFFGFPTTFPYDQCDLLEIDDLALFYVQSIAYGKDASGRVLTDSHGRPRPKAELVLKNLPFYLKPFVTDDLMESQSTIDGFRSHPTPEGLNRVIFLDPTPDFLAATMDPPVCKDGDEYRFQHAGTLPALELNGFYDQVRPVVQAFADHDREDLFVDVLLTLHSHWPSRRSLQHQRLNPNGHGYAKESDIHAYEGLIVSILDEDALWSALTTGAPVLDAIVAPSGAHAPEVLSDAARHLFRADSSLANRAGGHTTMTEDGRLVPSLSPWYVLADAYKAKRAQLAAAGAEGELWNASVSQVVDLLLRGENAGGTWRFKNPRIQGVSVALIDFLRARLAAHRAAGDQTAWLRTELPRDMERILTGPIFAAAADLVVALSAKPEVRGAVESLLVYLNTDGTDPFRSTVTVAADLLQWYADDPDLVPLTHLAGKALEPDVGLLDAQLTFVQRARHADDKQVLARLLGRLDGDLSPGRTPLAQIADTVSEVNRVRPFTDLGLTLTDKDYARVFQTVQQFLDDEKRGLKRFIHIVQNRNVVDED